jgi:hypothetical protein
MWNTQYLYCFVTVQFCDNFVMLPVLFCDAVIV